MKPIIRRVKQNSTVFIGAACAFAVLLLIIFLFPVEFSSYTNEHTTAPLWYIITETGGFTGGTVIVVVVLIYLLTIFKRYSKRKRDVAIFVSIVFAIQVLIAALSLYVVKDYFKNPRPSQLYFIDKKLVDIERETFLSMPSSEKRKYLQKKIDSVGKLEHVYPPILENWIYDSGYSFPSGHAQSGFFLGTVLCFVLYRLHPRKFYFVIPLIWGILLAVSRVVIGIHYPIDVAAGAFTGCIAGLIVISLNVVNKIFSNIHVVR